MTVSLTRFVDFVNLTGLKKAAVVTNAVTQDEYDPAKDFYKKFRETIVSMLKEAKPLEELSQRVLSVDERKIGHYKALTTGYENWASKKKLSYIKEDPRLFELNGLDISINPELILKIGHSPTVMKLYFKEEKLTKSSADMIVTLLALAYGVTDEYKNYDFAVLDIRRSRLFRLTPSIPVEKIKQMLEIESKSWLSYQAAI